MRKRYLFSCIAVFLLAGPAAAFGADKAGDVVAIRGKGVIEREKREIRAEKRTVLEERDFVSTGEKSRMKMLFRDDSVLALGSMSRLSVNQYLFSPEDKRSESVYELLDGKLRAVVGSSDLSVKTPTAFAAARGTIFVVWYDAKTDTTGIAVLEGEVLVRNVDGSVGGAQTLRAGQMTTVAGNNPPTLPEAFQAIRKSGGVAGNDIGPILYEFTFDGTPEISFIDTRGGGGTAGDNFFNTWEDKFLPRIIIDGDTYRPEPIMLDGGEFFFFEVARVSAGF